MNKNVDCRNCIHFKFSYDVEYPMLCTLYNIKTSIKWMPSFTVKQTLGSFCEFYSPRKNLKGKALEDEKIKLLDPAKDLGKILDEEA